jgi:hypothetical protein
MYFVRNLSHTKVLQNKEAAINLTQERAIVLSVCKRLPVPPPHQQGFYLPPPVISHHNSYRLAEKC